MLRFAAQSLLAVGGGASLASFSRSLVMASESAFYSFSAVDIDGNEVSMEKYKGNPCIVVNVASKWGLTSVNYTELVQLHEKYEANGLRILAFPCNQFGGQEPGTEAEIKKFAEGYGVKFDMFSKIKVNGDDAHPLWKFLKSKQGGTLGNFIKWNFTKFLVDKEGNPVARYSPQTNPIPAIEKDLQKYM